jgi:hypothetical protein
MWASQRAEVRDLMRVAAELLKEQRDMLKRVKP